MIRTILTSVGYLGIALVAVSAACSSPTVLQCQVAAVQGLPLSDPDSLTLGQTRELARQLKACEPRGDAGE